MRRELEDYLYEMTRMEKEAYILLEKEDTLYSQIDFKESLGEDCTDLKNELKRVSANLKDKYKTMQDWAKSFSLCLKMRIEMFK